jgi:uncharacterized membrane protein YjjP (DUF1212 family)
MADLTRDELTEAIEHLLGLGQRLLEAGATAPRTEAILQKVGVALGVDALHVLVSPNVIVLTTTEGKEFRTKARRIGAVRVRLDLLMQAENLARAVVQRNVGLSDLGPRLAALDAVTPVYPPLLVALVSGGACGAFAYLFQAGPTGIACTVAASTLGALVRDFMSRRGVHFLLTMSTVALVASLVAVALASRLPAVSAQAVVAASVLMLVPGVVLLNGVEEALKGYSSMALSRVVHGLLVMSGVTMGLVIAARLLGIGAP